MANNYPVGDPTGYLELYSFEDGALATGSLNSNTLTLYNSPTANTSDFTELAASINLVRASTQYAGILDTNLPIDWPGANGGSQRDFTIIVDVKVDTTAVYKCVYSKWTAGARNCLCRIENNNKLMMQIGNGSAAGDADTFITSMALSNGVWYTIGFFWNDSTKASKIRVYNRGTSTLLGSETDTLNKPMGDGAVPMWIGNVSGGHLMDGGIDSFYISKNVLTNDQFDAIAARTFGATPTYKISGTTNESSTIIVLNDNTWYPEATVSGVVGDFEVDTLTSGTKTVVAQNDDGKVEGFGKVNSIITE